MHALLLIAALAVAPQDCKNGLCSLGFSGVAKIAATQLETENPESPKFNAPPLDVAEKYRYRDNRGEVYKNLASRPIVINRRVSQPVYQAAKPHYSRQFRRCASGAAIRGAGRIPLVAGRVVVRSGVAGVRVGAAAVRGSVRVSVGVARAGVRVSAGAVRVGARVATAPVRVVVRGLRRR